MLSFSELASRREDKMTQEGVSISAFNGCTSVWAELKKSILEEKLEPLAFSQPPLWLSASLFPELPWISGFQAQAVWGEGRCARSLVVRSCWGDGDVPSQHTGHSTAIQHWPGSPWLPHHTTSESHCWEQRDSVGRCPALENCMAEAWEKWMDGMRQGALENACAQGLVPINIGAFWYWASMSTL